MSSLSKNEELDAAAMATPDLAVDFRSVPSTEPGLSWHNLVRYYETTYGTPNIRAEAIESGRPDAFAGVISVSGLKRLRYDPVH